MHADGCVGTPFRPSRVSDLAQQLPAEWSAILPGPSAPRARHGSQCDGPDGIVDGVHESGTNQCESSGLRASKKMDVTCQLRRRQTDWSFSSGKVRATKDEVVPDKARQSPEFVNSLRNKGRIKLPSKRRPYSGCPGDRFIPSIALPRGARYLGLVAGVGPTPPGPKAPPRAGEEMAS
jgi:hypothetical protein